MAVADEKAHFFSLLWQQNFQDVRQFQKVGPMPTQLPGTAFLMTPNDGTGQQASRRAVYSPKVELTYRATVQALKLTWRMLPFAMGQR